MPGSGCEGERRSGRNRYVYKGRVVVSGVHITEREAVRKFSNISSSVLSHPFKKAEATTDKF